jgi:Uri superfamily endonuclease
MGRARGGILSLVQDYRRAQIKSLTRKIGVYALCDLDGVPIYVGQSKDGIQQRVRRHLTSARSDIIANRLIDPWEIAFVQAYPVESASEIPRLEASVFATFHDEKPLMNGSVPRVSGRLLKRLPKPAEIIQMLPDKEIQVRRDPALRLPRQIEHIGRLVDHILTVKDSRRHARRRAPTAHRLLPSAFRPLLPNS